MKICAIGFAGQLSAKPGMCNRCSFSWGRIALLAFAQRQIRVSRADIPMNRQRRKHIPSIIATLGDYMQAKRYEKGLHRYQVADKMGIAASLVSAWESGNSTPDKTQWQMLSELLSFDSGVDLPKPHASCMLGFAQLKA
ncbi:MAG TPA: helix-turn-helix domain-containing protein [Sedimentisphaerales bacterium]